MSDKHVEHNALTPANKLVRASKIHEHLNHLSDKEWSEIRNQIEKCTSDQKLEQFLRKKTAISFERISQICGDEHSEQ